MVAETSPVLRETNHPRVQVSVPEEILGASAGLVLRYARDEDASAIVTLISAVWSEYPGKTLVAVNDMPELLAPAASYARCDGRFWVVEANGRIIGTIALQPSEEPGVIELQKLYVARDMRGNGLGGFLCGLVEREARERGAHAIELWSDVKLLDAHRRYERLGYRRGETLKHYADTSSTVRFYYRKELDADVSDRTDSVPDMRDGPPKGPNRWQVLINPNNGHNALPGIRPAMNFLSFTRPPAPVGENYIGHMRNASGFALRMIGGGLACLVHAVLPSLHTGSGVVADLGARMITNRRRPAPVREVAATNSGERSAA